MADLMNMQIYGLPLATYGMVGLTTGILAYVTAANGISDKIADAAKSVTDMAEKSITDITATATEKEDTAPPKEEETTEEAPPKEENEAPLNEETTGGKKNRSFRKKSKKTKGNRKRKTKRT
jgi:hypothetical protein